MTPAIDDYDKAIQLNPKDAEAYYYRGLAYGVLENINMYTQNLKTAAKLGQTEAREDLNSHGIDWQ
jgi:tetratricopeptide (TPR) repeat protein